MRQCPVHRKAVFGGIDVYADLYSYEYDYESNPERMAIPPGPEYTL